ncbi:MAG: hypothetical protein PHQ81_11075 [Methanofollis sp.]|nr:hypothetical protein [Methanofollis sp.]
MMAPDRRDGSPRDHLCASTGLTAPGEAIEFVDPVPPPIRRSPRTQTGGWSGPMTAAATAKAMTRTGTTVPVPAPVPGPPTFATLQQVYSRFPAGAAKINRRRTAFDLTVLVQIERRVSLLVLVYSKTHPHTVARILMGLRVPVGAISKMLQTIGRSRREMEINPIGRSHALR